ncbi:MAG: 4Fe-4S double cluster binding domain-containing protein [Promethearchaeota archaeon]
MQVIKYQKSHIVIMSDKKPKLLIQSKGERIFLDFCRKYPKQVIFCHKSSVTEGFEYLFNLGYKFSKRERLKQFAGEMGKLSALKFMIKLLFKLIKWRNRSFRDLHPYYNEIKSSTFLQNQTKSSAVNINLWEELNEYAANRWDIFKIGFTKLPTQLIFKNKFVLFRYALVFMQEMKKEKIDEAPLSTAGREVMRVYSTLGEAVAEIARWLRKRGVRCQANHPLGGLVCTPPLAGKAGMGWQGMHGMLITPEFGSRLRLAAIFVDQKIFETTENSDHIWIEEQCKKCRICQKNCPTRAIQEKKTKNIDNIEVIGAMLTCIDREKCFPQFYKTAGCSICIKVCPFSAGPSAYEKLKSQIVK